MADITEAEAQLYDRQVSQFVQQFFWYFNAEKWSIYIKMKVVKNRQIKTFTVKTRQNHFDLTIIEDQKSFKFH